jgi:hypothetical protein
MNKSSNFKSGKIHNVKIYIYFDFLLDFIILIIIFESNFRNTLEMHNKIIPNFFKNENRID